MKYLITLLLCVYCATNTLAHPTPKPSLREKIGQMLVIGFDGTEIDAQSQIVRTIQDNNIGGVILFNYKDSTKSLYKNISNPAQVKKLNQDLEYVTKQGNLIHHRPQLPLLISIDYEGGRVSRLEERYGFPSTLSAAELGKRGFKKAKAQAKAMANTLKEAHFNLNFAPELDVNVNPNNPIIGKKDRSFSNNPYKVTDYAKIYAHAFLQQKIQCAYKHFPGHGSSTKDSHLGFVDSTDVWQPNELIPFQKSIHSAESCGVIMTAHNINRQLDASGLPATLSHKMLTGLLRQKLHFKGVIITDDMQMKAISDNYGLDKSLVLAINAGVDMLLFGNNLSEQNPKKLIEIIEAKVSSGEIKEQRINEAYERIVALKRSLSP
jgi:beta-N-acetylhexosaminidase